ncbi:MAG: YIP1 family protein [archaeon]
MKLIEIIKSCWKSVTNPKKAWKDIEKIKYQDHTFIFLLFSLMFCLLFLIFNNFQLKEIINGFTYFIINLALLLGVLWAAARICGAEIKFKKFISHFSIPVYCFLFLFALVDNLFQILNGFEIILAILFFILFLYFMYVLYSNLRQIPGMSFWKSVGSVLLFVILLILIFVFFLSLTILLSLEYI